MRFELAPEQQALRATARRFLAETCPAAEVRGLMEDPAGFRRESWRALADRGLLGIAIEEAHGGSGLGLVELAVVHEELGRAVYPGPYLATVALAAGAIAAAGDAARARWLPAIARGELVATLATIEQDTAWTPADIRLAARRDGEDWRLDGRKLCVPFGASADLIVVAARTDRGITLFAVPRDAPGITATPMTGLDHAAKLAMLELRDVRAGGDAIVGAEGGGWRILEAVLPRAAVAASAEMLGAARRCFEMAVEYAKVRRQFGQAIGSFQAVKHACANMLLDVETSAGAVYYAAWTVDEGAPDAALACAAAKAHVSEAAARVAGAALQVHGGIGFTWDFDFHLPYKRALHYGPLYGDATFQREAALREMLSAHTATREE